MKPKIILWDIETSHNIVAAFQLYDANISHQAIFQERYIICGSWKELDKNGVKAVSVLDDHKRFKKDISDDYHVVKKLHEVLSDADAVIAHYGDKFDIKYLNTRILYHGLDPLPPIKQIDTYKMAKAKFLFNCNRLDYIGQFLGVGRKIKTSLDLWLGCLDGDEKSLKKMVRYNKQDVRLLEDVYKRLEVYCANKINMNMFKDFDCCPYCSSANIQSRGYNVAKTTKSKRYHCQDCGGWSSGNKVIR